MKAKDIIAASAVGVIGAFLGFSIGGWWYIAGNVKVSQFGSAITGFVVCFLLSIWFLHIMQGKSWRRGLLLGTGFGAMAGVISGFISGGISMWSYGFSVGVPLWGAITGIINGTIFGLVISAAVGPFYFRTTRYIRS